MLLPGTKLHAAVHLLLLLGEYLPSSLTVMAAKEITEAPLNVPL